MPVRLVLADDHPIVRIGISKVVEPSGMEIVGVTDSADGIMPCIEQHRPDVLVTEVRLRGQDALRVLEEFPASIPAKVIVFSALDNPTNIARAGALGCYEFLLKSDSPDELVNAIRRASLGEPAHETGRLMSTKTRMKRSSRFSNESPLTNRETQVLRHISMGLKNREIGKSLGISVETVKEHVQNILRKLDVNDRTQAAVWAIKREYI